MMCGVWIEEIMLVSEGPGPCRAMRLLPFFEVAAGIFQHARSIVEAGSSLVSFSVGDRGLL